MSTNHAHELADAWELRAGLTTDDGLRAVYRECAAELRALAAAQSETSSDDRGGYLYTPNELAQSRLQAAASNARRRAHGTDLKAYQDAVRDVGYAYLKAHPVKSLQRPS